MHRSTSGAGPFARTSASPPWAIILAGGDGTRLQPLTALMTGDDRPKQFCRIIGNETLLQQTKRRIACLAAHEKTVVVAASKHVPKFGADLAAAGGIVLTQPDNRGTGAAVLYSLIAIAERDPGANVMIFPSDHYFQNNAAFVSRVLIAIREVEQSPERIVLLGIVPNGPEVDYGWVEPGAPLFDSAARGSLCRVEAFWEKPPLPVAERLLARGCLWNSMVFAGSVRTLLRIMQATIPGVCKSFQAASEIMRRAKNTAALESLYANLPVVDFSRQVLARIPRALSVLSFAGAGWIDIGRPARVRELYTRGEGPRPAA